MAVHEQMFSHATMAWEPTTANPMREEAEFRRARNEGRPGWSNDESNRDSRIVESGRSVLSSTFEARLEFSVTS